MQQDRVDAGKKPLEGDKKNRDDMQDNRTVGETGDRKTILYKQPAAGCGVVCKDSEGVLVSGNNVLAFGCDI